MFIAIAFISGFVLGYSYVKSKKPTTDTGSGSGAGGGDGAPAKPK